MSARLGPALVGIAVGVLAVIAVSPAHGDHLEYAIDDPGWNPDGVTLVGINSPWIIDGEPYSLCPALSPIPGVALAAIADWETVLPQTEFTPGCTGSNLLLIQWASVSGVPDECNPIAAACAHWEKHSDAERGGKYTGTESFIWLNDVGYRFTDAGLRYLVAHELGHVFGLHEAYLYDTGPPEGYECNDPVDSIMDMAEIVVESSTRWVVDGCDGALLWPRDVSLVDDLYALSPAAEVASTGLGSDMRVEFRDDNWAESGYNVVVDWWDGSNWVPQDSWLHTANVAGVGHYIQVLYEKPAGRPAGLYRMCGDTFSQEHGSQHPFCAPGRNLTSGLADALDVPGGDIVSASDRRE